jgi:hypothetical protein
MVVSPCSIEDGRVSVDPNELMSLPAAEKLRIVELLWDNLGDMSTAFRCRAGSSEKRSPASRKGK